MSKQAWKAIAVLLFTAAAAMAADADDHEKLLGSWIVQDNAGKATESWTIDTKNDGFRIVETRGDNTLAEYSCKADGHDCDVKIGGKKATISMWFNGPKLVQLETQGAAVVKRRFAVVPEGDGLEIEVIPIVPDGKAETVRFTRVQASAGQTAAAK